MKRLSNVVFLLACLAALTQSQAANFVEELESLPSKHAAALEQASRMAFDGNAEEGNRALLSIAEPSGSAAECFLVGNMLYRSDTNASYRLHKKAFEAFTNEPFAALEWAMELHRRGQQKDAISLYRQALAGGAPDQFSALLADCLIRDGQLSNAVAAWKSADHPRHHTAIDFAIHEISGDLLPTQRRGALLAKIKKGEDALVEDLILLDANFDNDWWNSSVNERCLAADLKFAGQRLGTNSLRFVAMQAYARLKLKEEPGASYVRGILQTNGLILGAKGALPENSKLARALFEITVSSGADSATNLLTLHEQALMVRVKKSSGDRDALHALCYLSVKAQNERVAEFSRYGWEHWKDPVFAASLLAEAAASNSLLPSDKVLVAALELAPDDGVLNMLRLHACRSHQIEPSRDMLVSAIKAEYRRLTMGMMIPDSYTLKARFFALEQSLKQQSK